MAERRTLLVCSCEGTMPLDSDAFRRGCGGADLVTANQLCRAELDRFRTVAASKWPITLGCTQEARLFRESAAPDGDLRFVNLRETSGWSTDAATAGPKMAALAAASAEGLMPDLSHVQLESAGAILIYGCDDRAVEAANLLKQHLDVTLLTMSADNVSPPRVTDFPMMKGTIRAANGYLGAFEITVDNCASPRPSSRAALAFGPERDGAVLRCDILLDLSGGMVLFPAADLRDGYLRVDPSDSVGVLKAVIRARDLVGSFDKPRYIQFNESLCAHSRSGIVGCSRCLDLCPTGAIAPHGERVTIDASICAGCGHCATVCPTGAAAYALPAADSLMRKLRILLKVYSGTGGRRAIVLIHDEEHGGALIDALARHGDGLPANVLPLAVNEVTQVGLETIAAAFAYGAVALRLLLRARPRHDIAGLLKTIALAEPILNGLGLVGDRVTTIETDDPFAMGQALHAIGAGMPVPRPASFQPIGPKRDVLRLALRELHLAAAVPVEIIALPTGAPFGTVNVDLDGCTLCLACVSACPTGALSADSERPVLRFSEDACVQCGLCEATCPEKVITLTPQLDFRAAMAAQCVLKEEEPFHCIRCNTPFGVKSIVTRVTANLEGNHWMFQNSAKRLDMIKMCEDCRVAAATEQDFNPYGTPARPQPRTTEDYLREREGVSTA